MTREGEGMIMDSGIHDLIHLLSEVGKEEVIQAQSYERKRKLFDRIGKILDEMVKDEKKHLS